MIGTGPWLSRRKDIQVKTPSEGPPQRSAGGGVGFGGHVEAAGGGPEAVDVALVVAVVGGHARRLQLLGVFAASSKRGS